MENTSSPLEIRLHGTDGKFESFVQEDPVLAQLVVKDVQPARIFTLPKIVIAGTHSLSAFIPASLTRVDLIQKDLVCWGFPQGILDLIELSESEFRTKTHLNDQAHLEKRNQAETSGEFSVGFWTFK